MPARTRPDAVFDALADPTRRRIVERLGRAPATAGELAERLPVTRQAVVKHLALLETAGLVDGVREGRRVVYTLTPAPFAEAAQWMHDVGAAWDRRLERLSTRFKTSR
jgi:DNA-binding transcriptional ArsR family regulator